MRESISIQPWTYTVLVAVLSPLAAYFGSLWSWTPGAASMVILAVPTCAAALSGNRTTMLLTALLSSAGCYAEVLFVHPVTDADFNFVLPLFATCVFFASGGLVAAAAGFLRQRVDLLEDQNTQYVRRLYEQDRGTADQRARKQTAAPNSAEVSCDTDTINFAMLLLTLQDVGRRVSMSLDPESLFGTIVSASKASLKCTGCRVYLWNAADRSLWNPYADCTAEQDAPPIHSDRGLAKWVIEHRQIITRSTLESDYNLRSLLDEDSANPPDAIAPLTVGGEMLGLLVLYGVERESSTFMRLLYILADIYALGIKNSQLFTRIEHMARRDGLTGLLNHAAFHEDLQELFDAASAGRSQLSVIMGDIDHFKRLNDTYGHQAGDHVLSEVARLWKAIVPDKAICGRYGGEEFVCALPQENSEGAWELAEILRRHIEEHPFDFEGKELRLTSSFGVADIRQAESMRGLIRVADEALYAAKQSGRNRVMRSQKAATTAERTAEAAEASGSRALTTAGNE